MMIELLTAWSAAKTAAHRIGQRSENDARIFELKRERMSRIEKYAKNMCSVFAYDQSYWP